MKFGANRATDLGRGMQRMMTACSKHICHNGFINHLGWCGCRPAEGGFLVASAVDVSFTCEMPQCRDSKAQEQTHGRKDDRMYYLWVLLSP